MREHSWSENDDDRFSSMGATIRRKQPHNHQQPPPQQQQPPPEPVIKTHPKPTLLQSYRHSWRSRHNHFLRHSDVRVREKRQPTVQELAADGGGAASLIQALGGWKVSVGVGLCDGQVRDVARVDVTKAVDRLVTVKLIANTLPDLAHGLTDGRDHGDGDFIKLNSVLAAAALGEGALVV